jgi:predicted kinase
LKPTLFLICGLPCSGKTTLARRLEVEHHAIRLTPDEWIAELLDRNWTRAELDRLRTPVEAVHWGISRSS